MADEFVQETEERISELSKDFILDIEDILKNYEEEIANLQEETEGEMDALRDDAYDEDEIEENEDYQELDGLYDSLQDILNSAKAIRDALEDIRNYT